MRNKLLSFSGILLASYKEPLHWAVDDLNSFVSWGPAGGIPWKAWLPRFWLALLKTCGLSQWASFEEYSDARGTLCGHLQFCVLRVPCTVPALLSGVWSKRKVGIFGMLELPFWKGQNYRNRKLSSCCRVLVWRGGDEGLVGVGEGHLSQTATWKSCGWGGSERTTPYLDCSRGYVTVCARTC